MNDLIQVVAALAVEDGRVLVALRTQVQSFSGLWEFPGGKMEPGETPQQSLVRELREELGLEVEVGDLVEEIENRSSGKRVRIRFYRAVRRAGSEPRALEVDEFRWADADDLRSLEFIPANRPIVKRMIRELKSSGSSPGTGS